MNVEAMQALKIIRTRGVPRLPLGVVYRPPDKLPREIGAVLEQLKHARHLRTGVDVC